MLSCYYLLPRENRGYAKCCPLLSVGTHDPSGIKFLIGNFTEVLLVNFILDWEIEIVNHPALETDSAKN